MAGKGQPKTGGRNWKKGESGNPDGKRAFPVELQRVRRMTVNEYADMASKMLGSPILELERIYNDETEPGMNRVVAGVVLKAFQQKCGMTLELLLQRVLGRVRDVTPDQDDKSRNGQALLAEFRNVINDPGNERKG